MGKNVIYDYDQYEIVLVESPEFVDGEYNNYHVVNKYTGAVESVCSMLPHAQSIAISLSRALADVAKETDKASEDQPAVTVQ